MILICWWTWMWWYLVDKQSSAHCALSFSACPTHIYNYETRLINLIYHPGLHQTTSGGLRHTGQMCKRWKYFILASCSYMRKSSVCLYRVCLCMNSSRGYSDITNSVMCFKSLLQTLLNCDYMFILFWFYLSAPVIVGFILCCTF